MLAALARACPGVFQRVLKVAGSHAQAGKQAEEHGGEDSYQHSPAECGSVDVQSAEQGKRDGSLVAQPAEEPVGEAQSKNGSHTRKNETLCEKLAHDAGAAGAQGGAHRELFRASGSSSK